MSVKYISGKMLKRVRLSKSLTQKQVGERCTTYLFQTQVSTIEKKNKIPITNINLHLIVKALGMTIEEALERTDAMYKYMNKHNIDNSILHSLPIEKITEMTGRTKKEVKSLIDISKYIKDLGLDFSFDGIDLDTIRIDFNKKGI